jgi:hypothetical protein
MSKHRNYMKKKFVMDFYDENWRNANDTRTVTISLSIRFGKAISDLRKHNATGAQSEQNR